VGACLVNGDAGEGLGQAALEDSRRAVDGRRSGSSSVSPAYLARVIQRLHVGEAGFDPERRREVAEQERVLLRLQCVLASRLSSGLPSPNSSLVAFDAELDDDEALLLLMQEVDVDGNGAVSEAELFGASTQLHPEMKAALASVFACDAEVFEEALSHLDAADFGDYCRGGRQGGVRSPGAAPPFDAKASARAVFEAALAPLPLLEAGAVGGKGAVAGSSKSPDADDQGIREAAGAARVAEVTAASSTVRPSSSATKANLEVLAARLRLGSCEPTSKLAAALTGLAETLLGAGCELDFLAVKRAARSLPRMAGQRLEWVRAGVGLDAALARHLPPGKLDDCLAGVRGMPLEEAQRAMAAFIEEAKIRFLEALVKVKTAKGSKSAFEANSKFTDGFQGSFASLSDFHAGAEATLKTGYPNPNTGKGIRLEHTQHPSVERLYVSSNYRIATSLLIEYAWAVLQERPAAVGMDDSEGSDEEGVEDQALTRRALDLLMKLAVAREEPGIQTPGRVPSAPAAATVGGLLFPGEVGDSFSESLLVLRFHGSGPADVAAAKRCTDAAKASADALLGTEEERVRGITMLDHGACAERIARDASVLPSQSSVVAASANGPLLVGLLLPMSSTRAEALCERLRSTVAEAAEPGDVGAVMEGQTKWSFCQHTSVEGLRKWLGERSLEELQSLLDAEGRGGLGQDVETHEALCQALVTSFVRTELRSDLAAALESGASDAKVEALLAGWSVPGPHGASRAERIAQAVSALDSEERWGEVRGWVRLHRGRIQGRTRLGLKGLMKREEKRIKQYRLTKSEVLGLYLYTGACFLNYFSAVSLGDCCLEFPPAAAA
jgi:hypothetical protein